MTKDAAAAPSRFLSDSIGTYDLASVSAITINNGSKPPGAATLLTDGGDSVHTATPYGTAVAAWKSYLGAEDAPASAEPAK